MRMLLLLALVVGSGNLWAGTYTYDIGSNGANGFYTNSELTTHPGTGNSKKISSFYASDGKLFTASATNIYFSAASSGYLFVTGGVTLTLPTYSGEKITNITLYNSGSCSTSVSVSIVSGSSTASSSKTWSTQSSNYSYDITSTYQSTTLGIAVASGKNAQITKMVITTESIGDIPNATVSTAELDFGKVDFGYSKDLTFKVTPSNLTGNLTIFSNNAKYTVSPTSIAQATTTETTVTVTASPTAIDDDMDGEITISGGGITSKTVTLSCSVTDPSKGNGSLERPYSVAEVNDGYASGNNEYVVGYIVGEFEAKDKDAKTSEFGGTNLALSDSPTEISGENTIAVQLPSGSLRTAWNLNNNKVIGYKVRVKGTLTGYFADKTGVKPPTEIIPLTIPVTVGAKGYATYCNSKCALDFTGKSIKAYVVKSTDGSALTLTQVNKVAKNTPLLLYSATNSDSQSIPAIADSEEMDDITGNKLVAGTGAALTWEEGTTEYYILYTGGDKPGFYRANNSTVAVGKAYLDLTGVSGSREFFSFFDDETTGINAIDVENANAEVKNNVYYNLNGQRVANPSKGLYIVNGKKVIMK